jgi:hypothetical protein
MLLRPTGVDWALLSQSGDKSFYETVNGYLAAMKLENVLADK